MRIEKIASFMAVALAFMFLAVFVGIFRLMSMNFFATGILSGLYGLHSIIMVFGFLAVIIMTERVAAVRLIPGAQRFRASALMVPSVAFGVVTETFGYAWQILILRFVGAALLVGGCVAI